MEAGTPQESASRRRARQSKAFWSGLRQLPKKTLGLVLLVIAIGFGVTGLASLGLLSVVFLIVLAFVAWRGGALTAWTHERATDKKSVERVRAMADGAPRGLGWVKVPLRRLARWLESDRSTLSTLVARESGAARMTIWLTWLVIGLYGLGALAQFISIGQGTLNGVAELLTAPSTVVVLMIVVLGLILFRAINVAMAAAAIFITKLVLDATLGSEGPIAFLGGLWGPIKLIFLGALAVLLVVAFINIVQEAVENRRQLAVDREDAIEKRDKDLETDRQHAEQSRREQLEEAALQRDEADKRREEREERELEYEEIRGVRQEQDEVDAAGRRVKEQRWHLAERLVGVVVIYMVAVYVVEWMEWRNPRYLTTTDDGRVTNVPGGSSPLYTFVYQLLAIAALFLLVRQLYRLARQQRSYAWAFHTFQEVTRDYEERATRRKERREEEAKEEAERQQEAEEAQFEERRREAKRLREDRDALDNLVLATHERIWALETQGKEVFTNRGELNWHVLAQDGIDQDLATGWGVDARSYRKWSDPELDKQIQEGRHRAPVFTDQLQFNDAGIMAIGLHPNMLKARKRKPADYLTLRSAEEKSA